MDLFSWLPSAVSITINPSRHCQLIYSWHFPTISILFCSFFCNWKKIFQNECNHNVMWWIMQGWMNSQVCLAQPCKIWINLKGLFLFKHQLYNYITLNARRMTNRVPKVRRYVNQIISSRYKCILALVHPAC